MFLASAVILGIVLAAHEHPVAAFLVFLCGVSAQLDLSGV